ncbi:MAG: TraR/DksA C4-type zinc finger protein [Candidatus Chisholmbacteria bacterium]|nr:TraR/DksA C4-type zinc finger protein [Candidatus Chisholmbacteria bacterium]
MRPISFPANVLEPVKKFLLKKQEKLKQRKLELEAEDPFVGDNRLPNHAASDSGAVEEVSHDRVAALKWEVDKGLINIRKTLTRIKLGNYGLCENCGRLIDTDRLAIDPTATLCVECSGKKK